MKRTVTPQWGKSGNLGKIEVDLVSLPSAWFSGPHADKLRTLAENSIHIGATGKFITDQIADTFEKVKDEKREDFLARTYEDAREAFAAGDYSLPESYEQLLPLIGTRKSPAKALAAEIKAMEATLASIRLLPGMDDAISKLNRVLAEKREELAEANDDTEE